MAFEPRSHPSHPWLASIGGIVDTAWRYSRGSAAIDFNTHFGTKFQHNWHGWFVLQAVLLEFQTLNWYIRVLKGGLIDISNCTSLCDLRLFNIPADRDRLRSSCRILSQVSSRNLADLTLEFSKGEGINFDWTPIANILSGSTFTHLGNIHVESAIYSSSVVLTLYPKVISYIIISFPTQMLLKAIAWRMRAN